MTELPGQVQRSIRARGLFRPGQGVLVAVSGGVDSIVLLHVLHGLARKQHWRLTVAHLNHRLRGRSSDADERLVRRTAEKLKLPVVTEKADVRQLARAEGLSVEMAARKLRHDFLARIARQRHIPSIALAHHADDQLELFFLRLLRGSGGEGLAGMKWRSPSPSDPEIQMVRPLLDQPKAALREYAAQMGIRYREDASNALPAFQRNRIRHELLPLLRRKYQPALGKTILRAMEIVGAEAEFAGRVAEEWLRGGRSPKAEARRPKEGRRAKSEGAGSKGEGFWRRWRRVREWGRGQVPFEELPVAVQRRCLALQLLRQGVEPDYDLVEQLRLRADRSVAVSATQDQGGGLQGRGGLPVPRYAVRERSGMVRLQGPKREEFNTAFAEVDLQGRAGEVEFDGARIGWRIGAGKAVGRPRPGAGRECFDADRVGSPVRLRHWQPGDRFQPIGMSRAVKLQDFFTNQKVPRDRRRQLVVAATVRGELFWVEGMRISERFKLTKGTKRRLQWCWRRL